MLELGTRPKMQKFRIETIQKLMYNASGAGHTATGLYPPALNDKVEGSLPRYHSGERSLSSVGVRLFI